MDKKIKLGIDYSEVRSYGSEIEQLYRRAEEMSAELIGAAREQHQSSREIIKDVEEQIRLIERRNALSARGQRFEAQTDTSLSKDQVESRLELIKRDEASDKLTIDVLRDILNEIKETSQEEIRANREAVEVASRQPGFGKYSEDKSERQILQEIIQKDALREQDEVNQRKSGGGGLGVGIIGQTTSAVGGASNVYDAALNVGGLGVQAGSRAAAGIGGIAGGAMLGAGAILAGGLMVAGKGIAAYGAAEPSYMRMAALGGGGLGAYSGFGESAEEYGYTMDVVANRRADMSLARLSAAGSGRAALESLQLERGLGISGDVSSQIERFNRPGGGGVSAMDATQQMISYMKATGIISGGDMSAVPEYMQSLVQISRQQLQTLGSVDTGINAKMIAGIANLDKTFQNPEILTNVVSSLQQGLTQSTTPQMEALQYSVLNRIAPGKDIFQLMRMREDPFGVGLSGEIEEARRTGDASKVTQLEQERGQRQQYLPEMLSMIQQISGGNQGVFDANILSAFPQLGSMAQASRLRKGFESGNLDVINQEGFGEGGGINVAGRAVTSTGDYTRELSKFTNTFQNIGEGTIEEMKKLLTGMTTVGETLEQAAKDFSTNAQAITTLNQHGTGILDKILSVLEKMPLVSPQTH